MNSKAPGPGSSPCDVPSVLVLRPRSVSINKQSHLTRLHSETLIEWWRKRIGKRRNARVYVLVHTEQERHDLLSLPLKDTFIIQLPHSGQTLALAALASTENLEHLALVTLGTALLPAADFDDLIAIYLKGRNAISWCTGISSGIGPCFLSRQVLQSLAKLPPSWLASNPVASYRNLNTLITQGATLESFSPAKYHVFDLAARYNVKPAEIPLQINFEGEDAIQIAREVLRPTDDPDGIDGLRLWKKALIARRSDFFDRCRVDPGRRTGVSARDRRRVLYVSNASAFSGAEESLCQMVQKIDRSRYEVYAAVGMPSRLQERLEDAGAVVTAFADGFRDPTVRNFVQVRDLLSSIQPDIIHSNAINGFPLLWNSIDKRIPFIQHVRNGNMRGYREYVESASAVIAVSKYLGDNVLRFAIRPDRVHVVYNEVDTEYFDSSRFDRSIARKRHRIPEEAKVIA